MQHKENKITQRIILSLIASMITMSLSAQTTPKRPSLVVGIMIDGLNQEYIDKLRNHFGEEGFNRILKEGVVFQNIDYGTSLDLSAATALIYSGSAPSVNGIPSCEVYDTENKKSSPILLDPSKIGNFTNETYSPAALLVSTITDEIKIDADGLNQVHSIAPDAIQSILMAGHAANSAFWINDNTGKWATTTHYKDVPTTISGRNHMSPLSTRLNQIEWKPTLDISKYPDLPEHRHFYPFRYTFPDYEANRYQMFKSSACVNSEITSVATDYITTLSLGTHKDGVDMLNVAYTLTPYPYTRIPDARFETMDAYIKLDLDLAKLFATIDSTVGMKNTLVFIAGTPARHRSRRDDEKWNLPSGQFSTRRAMSLLNMYLMAKHGTGEWVNGIHNNNLYFNHQLIKNRNLNVVDMRQDAVSFLMKMSGITSAYTIDDIIARRIGENPEALYRNTNLKYTGDVIFTVAPGWSVDEDENGVNKSNVVRLTTPTAPAYILAPQVSAQTISTPVDARAIAPTVTRLLRIRSPNSATVAPLQF